MVRTEFIPEGSYQRPEKYSVFYGNRNASVCHAHSSSLNLGSVLGYMDKLETFSLDLFPCFVDGYLMHFFTLCRPPTEFIPPVQEPYQYIIFRASEVKDLSVDEPAAAPLRNVHDDPAVLGVCHSRHHISIFHFLRLPLFAERNNNIPGKTCPLGATPSIISIFSPRIYF